MNSELVLEMRCVTAGYGDKPVLNRISLKASRGQTLLLIGPNGAGKSTVLKTVFGLVRISTGEMYYEGNQYSPSPRRSVERRIAFVPQGGLVFPTMTVLENLQMGTLQDSNGTEVRWTAEDVLDKFPTLRERLHSKAGTLSGGQKQQLSIARALVARPKLLLLDEPSIGLSAQLLESLFISLKSMVVRNSSCLIIVEHRLAEAGRIADLVYGLKMGTCFFTDSASALTENDNLLRQLFL